MSVVYQPKQGPESNEFQDLEEPQTPKAPRQPNALSLWLSGPPLTFHIRRRVLLSLSVLGIIVAGLLLALSL